MKLMTLLVGITGCVSIAIGIFGRATGSMSPLELHTYFSEGMLLLIFATVLGINGD